MLYLGCNQHLVPSSYLYRRINTEIALTDLKTPLDSFQLLFCNFGMPSCHVRWLLCIERVSNASWYEHIQLNSSFTFFFFPFLLVLQVYNKRPDPLNLLYIYAKNSVVTAYNTKLFFPTVVVLQTFKEKFLYKCIKKYVRWLQLFTLYQ